MIIMLYNAMCSIRHPTRHMLYSDMIDRTV